MFGLGHIDMMPLFYGVIMFFGMWSLYHKIKTIQIIGFIIELTVFVVVFALHGGTMTGGFAAMIAALLAGFFFAPKKKKPLRPVRR